MWWHDQSKKEWKIRLNLKQLRFRDGLNVEVKNWKIEKPFILLVGGLGMSKKIFNDFGVSRFNTDCSFNLEPLDQKSERVILKKWIIKKGNAKENDSKMEFWIDKITEQTHGWAHHITNYGIAASDYLKKD